MSYVVHLLQKVRSMRIAWWLVLIIVVAALAFLLPALLVFLASPPNLQLQDVAAWVLVLLLVTSVFTFVRELYIVFVTRKNITNAIRAAAWPILFAIILAVYQTVFVPWVDQHSAVSFIIAGHAREANVQYNIGTGLNVREVPGGRVIGSLAPGTRVIILSREVKLALGVPWVRVRVDRDQSGWVSLCYLDLR